MGGADEPLFEAYGVDPVIEGMLSRRVDLPSGGYLMIDYAEALTVIDVNTGSFTGKGKSARLEDTITRTNLEAAEEVVNQLRLRDIGGIIVIDFIDMARARNRDAVLKVLRKALDEDRTKTFVVEISPLGLVEMTRQNVTDGAREIMTKTCPTCDGEGVVKSEETIAIEVERRLRELVARRRRRRPRGLPRPHQPEGHGATSPADGARMLHELEAETGRFFHFEGSEGLPLDHFAVTMEGTRGGDRGAAPCRSARARRSTSTSSSRTCTTVDDAVAKIDGYIIEVADGDRLRGQKRLVRIEEAGRTAASAVLIEPPTRPRRRPRSAAGRASARRSARRRRARAGRASRPRRPRRCRRSRTTRAVEAGTAPAAVVDADEDAATLAAPPPVSRVVERRRPAHRLSRRRGLLRARGGRSIVGNIYKGKVDNVLPGLEAAFVDFG